MPHEKISIEKAKELIDQGGATVIDIRDQQSYTAGHIEGAQLIDSENVESFIASTNQQRPLIVCCYHGNMSQSAAAFFSEQGFTEAYSLDGGYVAWASQYG